MRALALDAGQILSIPSNEPERLFETPDTVHTGFRALARRWHPDRGGSDAVFSHITLLRLEAERRIEQGEWHTPGLFEFRADGKQFRVRYVRAFDFELGKLYLGKTLLTYALKPEFDDRAKIAQQAIAGLRFPDSKTESVMTGYLPKLTACHATANGTVLVISKPESLIRLRDLRDHLGGKLPGPHVAWIVSRLLNHASYLEWAKLTHNDISLDSVFISPADHTIALLGGWWYAAPVGEPMTVLPSRTHAITPADVLADKRANSRIDLALIRLLGRELLGDASGMTLAADPDLRKEIGNWLRLSGAGSAVQDYTEWREKVLGPRKFVTLPVTAAEVYPELG